ncbi:MAG TPA: sodium:proton antiporter [Candidatus Limnocylindria bacterium]|jgi:CPA1 family monovalent cation:H+ antiporter
MSDPVAIVRLAVALIAAATIVAAAARRVWLPDSVLLVLVGLGGGALLPELHLAISPALVLSVYIPGLVFAAAYSIDWSHLRPVLAPVIALAIPGVVVSGLVVAFVLNLWFGLPIGLAFVVGAATAATDPVAVVATMARLNVPTELRTLVEGESLLNDGTGLVLFALAVRAVSSGVDLGEAAVLFVSTVTVSVIVGIVGGLVGARAMLATRDRTMQLAISLVIAYGTYELADAVGLSGILATVIAGIALGTVVRRAESRGELDEEVEGLWDVIAFVLTSSVFLLIGFAITVPALIHAASAIAVGTVAIVAGRALIVYLPTTLSRLRRGRDALPRGWAHVVFWSGLRGAIALAAALSLPSDFPARQLLQEIIFGIVLVTLVLQGGTAPLIVRRSLRAARQPPEVGDRVDRPGAPHPA